MSGAASPVAAPLRQAARLRPTSLLLRTLRALLAGAALLLAGAPVLAAPLLVWLTSDVTPPARTALMEELARQAGFELRHVELPLRGGGDDAALRQSLDAGLAAADWVWVDAPHAAVRARIDGAFSQGLAAFERSRPGRLVATDRAEGGAPAQRIAAYLRAGGAGQWRLAFELAAAVAHGRPLPELPPPVPFPARGLYHPRAPGLLADAAAAARWQAADPAFAGRAPVAVLVHRHHLVDGSTAWLDRWLALFEAAGFAPYAAFSQPLDAASLGPLLEVDGRLHARAIVTHLLLTPGAALQPLFERWGAPVLATLPYRGGDAAAWQADPNGLALADVPFYLAQPEAAGGIDPLLVTAQGGRREGARLIEPQARAVIAKLQRLLALRDTPPADKRLVAMVYNYPAGASNFGASFLNVPRSLERVTQALAEAGYRSEPLSEAEAVRRLGPLLAAYYEGAELRELLDRGDAAALPLARYRAWFESLAPAVRERILAHWGAPERSRFVLQQGGEPVFVIPRLQLGQLSVLPQPPREETLRRGQYGFSHRNRVPLSHHYLAVYLWAREAHALIHFGTHGTQEWANGKLRALSVDDDALLPLGDVPVVYPYIVDNLGEALTAKRRGRATMVSHRTPSFAPAGFQARMSRMHELMHEWETAAEGPTRQSLERALLAQFVEHQLHRDLGWSAERIQGDFAHFIEQLHPWLDRLAQDAQPQGLAVFGRVPEPAARRLTILQALRQPLIEALGEDIDEAFLIDYTKVATSRPARWLDVALRDAEAAAALDLRPPLPDGPVPNRAARQPIDRQALRGLALRAQALERLLATEGEIPGLLHALEGRFLPAAYGGDPIRNPDSLPTGRNLTGLDPSRLPTRQAWETAQALFADWLAQWRREHGGQAPQRLALSLWAGETLRHQGVQEAQALVALGVEPVWDASGRPTAVRLLPAAQLGRPRVDVLLSVTGSYRDQFPALMALVDQAVAVVSRAEPEGGIAAASRAVTRELMRQGVTLPAAERLGRVRAFGNAPGDYGTGLSEAVQSDGLAREDRRLGGLFLERMSQPFLDGAPLAEGAGSTAGRAAFAAHLRRTDAALLSRSSHLYGMMSSDDPFQYLGGLAAAARSAGRKEPLALYVNQLEDGAETLTQSAAQGIALEMQSRYLHPGWLAAQRDEGYAGTLQVVKALQFAWGWQQVARDSVREDHWQGFYDTLVRDRHRLGLPEWLRSHPQAYAQALERLVQAQRQGWWRPDAETRRELAGVLRSLEKAAPRPDASQEVQRWVRQSLTPPPVAPPETARAQHPAVPPATEAPAARPEPPRGIRLRPVESPPEVRAVLDTLLQLLLAAAALAVPLGGAAYQLRGGRLREPAAAVAAA
ncbi:cobaltochelatase subunit CobN [Aquabacterium sp. A7-Y]|uniref:cobaltochelatase subunit CobN n=1 Tax=Aquabacterium sp. A7-Y TaxID=1349605 RepID=UPI00223D201D|nr:cobaltochelatase subunit CobN [Aquabacterium sp. A7-Y]MCW7539938.1 cobaltochelatase subunit CobN [Aquabacterium sp. A7-Y]